MADDRREILRIVRQGLGIRDEHTPEIRIDSKEAVQRDGYTVDVRRGESWPRVTITADLYSPAHPAGVSAIIFCGHGAGGRRHHGYQLMAARLARRGVRVLVADNIGQGQRLNMGHGDVVGPFAGGLTLAGLTLMESIAWIRWMSPGPLAIAGNSGGGKLTLLLAALCAERLDAVVSSGFPSRFEFIARKEKKLCHCTILPGIVGQVEMADVLGCFVPGSMLLMQGK